MTVQALARGANPFDDAGTHRRADGVNVYDDLPASLVAELLDVAERSPEVEAIVELGGERLTYRDLVERASRVAGGLVADGLQPGERVALRLPAGAEWVVGFWGILLARGVVVAVNTRFAPPEVEHVLADSGADRQFLPDYALPDGEAHIGRSAAADDIAAIFYTSGTTGRPKGVPTSHLAFLSNSETMVRCMGIDRAGGGGLRTLISVPLFHVTGCNAQLLTALHVGGTAVILPALDLQVLLSTIVDERISFLVTVPAVYNLVLRQAAFAELDVNGVRWVGYGGAPIASSLVRSLQNAFPNAEVFNGFGATETASIVSVLPNAEAAEHADSVGYPAPVVDIAVDPPGQERGELLVRGPNVLRHYWNETSSPAIADGWFRMGDIVTVDSAGRISIVDRAKDMINR
ncbi:MAG: AMP-binding protein, partial [Actinomycetota bacterium]|nr:AMP-binding protein [Actinomycetota bacterium]